MATKNISKSKSRAKPHSKKPFIIIISIAIGIATIVLFDMFTPVWGGQIKYYGKWIDCGQRPQQENGWTVGHIEYHILSPAFSIWRSNHTNYYCTAKEAEKAGLSNSPDTYDFPNLTQEEYEAAFGK